MASIRQLDNVMQRRDRVRERVKQLISGFPTYVATFDEWVPFTRSGQYELHADAIRMRRALGSVAAALRSDDFLLAVRSVLLKWGLGVRGSRLAAPEAFLAALRKAESSLIALEPLTIDAGDQDIGEAVQTVSSCLRTLEIVDNKARIVSVTKALHHLLPDLILPMDREYTGAFFGWHGNEFQNHQESVFKRSFMALRFVALEVDPQRYVGKGWRTSRTKVLDNALVGYCLRHNIQKPS